MTERPEAEAKKAAAWKLSEAYLDQVFKEKAFDCAFDRGTAVAVATMRFIMREKVDPFVYLQFVRNFLDHCVVVLDPDDEEGVTWH